MGLREILANSKYGEVKWKKYLGSRTKSTYYIQILINLPLRPQRKISKIPISHPTMIRFSRISHKR